MKFSAGVFVLLGFSIGLFGQQPVNPGYTHPNDQATFGNQKAPKREKAPTTRTVTGLVTDETGQPLAGAMVTLTDGKTKEKTSFFTKKDGRYHFEELSFDIDYKVQARYKDRSSDERPLSQFDRTPKPVRILQINTENLQEAGSSAAAKKNTVKPQ
jgi:hypothetical protein